MASITLHVQTLKMLEIKAVNKPLSSCYDRQFILFSLIIAVNSLNFRKFSDCIDLLALLQIVVPINMSQDNLFEHFQIFIISEYSLEEFHNNLGQSPNV